MFVDLVPSK